MSYAAGAAGAGAAAAAIAQAIKASGAIVRVEPADFMTILSRSHEPLVVLAETKFIRTAYRYLTSYKGLIFYTKSPMPLELTSDIEVITAKNIWIPG